MKRILAYIITFSLLFAIAGCRTSDKEKKEIFSLVTDHYDAIVTACNVEDTQALSAIDGVEDVDIVDGYVLVYCQDFGLAPASQNYGFYYAADAHPAAVWDGHVLCDTEDLLKDDGGYRYEEDGNFFYTEHIQGNLYYYSASF